MLFRSQVALEQQLASPLTELISLFRSSPAEVLTGEKPGQCHPALLALPPEKLKEILEEAGWHRLRQRRSLAQARVVSLGYEQAVWVALAEGLGFSENREPFASLARAVPIRKLLEIPDPVERGAVLYGVAGLLPDPTRSKVSDRALPWLRQLWDCWWRRREDWGPYILPAGIWRLGGTRPNNSPYRRLAALASLSYPVVWESLVESVRTAEEGAFLKILVLMVMGAPMVTVVMLVTQVIQVIRAIVAQLGQVVMGGLGVLVMEIRVMLELLELLVAEAAEEGDLVVSVVVLVVLLVIT